MVGWFDPGQLLRTAVEVVVSSAFARNSDRRLLDALTHPTAEPCDYSAHAEMWLDYVADTGDGWNSTYAIAHAVAQPSLTLAGAKLDRGDVLVFGGDEVYPVASREEYNRRLLAPYRTALPETTEPSPTVFAVAGNHDWYDSLVSFSRIFCNDGPDKKWFGGWRTHQSRSYFAARLSHGWWLIGTDVQLESDIDDPQLAYFRDVAAQMKKDDRVILCTAEPHWIYEQRYSRFDPSITQKNLTFLETTVFDNRVAVFLAGDLHHYRRHENAVGQQKITAGGGGAFLYPTHCDADEVQTLRDGYEHRASYPDVETSRGLSRSLLRFARINPSFGLATGFAYPLVATAFKVDVGTFGIRALGHVFHLVLIALFDSQSAMFWTALIFLGFFFFTDTHDPRFKKWGGIAHASAHLLAAVSLWWLGAFIAESVLSLRFGGIGQNVLTLFVAAVGGYLVGPRIMGLYLYVAMNVFRRHAGEFSAVRCADYKSWLRMHITREGDLDVHVIGIDSVPRSWAPCMTTADQPSLLVASPSSGTGPRLVDSFTVRKGR